MEPSGIIILKPIRHGIKIKPSCDMKMKDYKKLLKVVEFSQNDPADNQVDNFKLNNSSSNEVQSSTSSPKSSSNGLLKQGQVSANNYYSHNRGSPGRRVP